MRFGKQEQRHIVDILFVLALFCVFAVSALMLVTMGANVYKGTVSDMSDSFSDRTAYSYITEKIRQNDMAGCIGIGSLDDTPALILSEKDGDKEYDTYLYLFDGYLCELLMQRGSYVGDDPLSIGQKIMPLEAFDMEQVSDSLVKLSLGTGTSKKITVYATIRSEQ